MTEERKLPDGPELREDAAAGLARGAFVECGGRRDLPRLRLRFHGGPPWRARGLQLGRRMRKWEVQAAAEAEANFVFAYHNFSTGTRHGRKRPGGIFRAVHTNGPGDKPGPFLARQFRGPL